MGLDQHIWAEIEVSGVKKQVAIHYWRKQYAIDQWFFNRLSNEEQIANEDEEPTIWQCPVTTERLRLLDMRNWQLALDLGFDLELIDRCDGAIAEGFTLYYHRNA